MGGVKWGRREKNKKTRNLSRVPPWLLSTLLIVSGSVEDATFSSPLLSIWCHRKWNFISYSAAITLDRAYQDKADSYLQICFSCGTINHRALAILHTCFSRQLFWGVCTVNWLLQGSQGLWYAMLASLLSPLLSPRIDSTGRSSAKWEQHLALLLCCYTPPSKFPVDRLAHNTDQKVRGAVCETNRQNNSLLWHCTSSKLQQRLAGT